MLANDRVITIAASSPAGETSVTSARAASGLSARQVTATVGWPAARIRSATLTASDVEPEREMITTGSRPAARPARQPRCPDEHALRPKDQLRQRRRDHRPVHHRARHRGDDLGEVVRGARAGDDDPLRRGEDVPGGSGRPAVCIERAGDRLAGRRALAPGQQVLEGGHRSRSSTE